jgi:hypothetical protein
MFQPHKNTHRRKKTDHKQEEHYDIDLHHISLRRIKFKIISRAKLC